MRNNVLNTMKQKKTLGQVYLSKQREQNTVQTVKPITQVKSGTIICSHYLCTLLMMVEAGVIASANSCTDKCACKLKTKPSSCSAMINGNSLALHMQSVAPNFILAQWRYTVLAGTAKNLPEERSRCNTKSGRIFMLFTYITGASQARIFVYRWINQQSE